MDPHRLRAYILLLIVTAIWGIAGPVIKFTLGGISPLLFLTYRFGLSSLVAVFSFLILGIHIPKERKTILYLLLYGFLTSTVSLGLLFFGLENTTVLDMTLITLIIPLLAAFAGIKFLHEHVTLREKLGMGIALIGTVFTVLEPIFQNGIGGSRLSGNILIFVYLFAAIAGSILAKELLRREVSPLTMTNLSFVIGFVTLLPAVLLTQGFFQSLYIIYNLPIPYQLGVFFMALISGTLAYFLANRAQKTIEVGEAAVFSYLYPIFAAPLAVFWLGEKITPTFIVGAVVIATGVIIAEYKKRKYN